MNRIIKKFFEQNMQNFSYRLMNEDDNVTARMAETNFIDWDLSDVRENKGWFIAQGRIRFVATLILSGSDPYPDGSFCGSEIEVEVEGEATIGEGGQWKIDSYQTRANIIDFV